jgi:tRNA modification GTPase
MAFDLARLDTICAVATARGRAAIAIVRWSGPAAFAIRDALFRRRRTSEAPSALAVRGDVLDDDGSFIDDALCTSFVAPHTVTGEDVVELAVHGGPVIADLVVARLLRLGCRAAEPGEFTLRAVLSGRIDLAAAEAVEAVVGARTTSALKAAQRSLRGGLATAIAPARAHLVDVLAELEARLDFPDEPLGDAARQPMLQHLAHARAVLRATVATASTGRRLQDGARVVLWGAPNAGKSTLLNTLVGHERALVHDEPGTTRDALDVSLDVGGVPVVVVDVAGVRDGDGIHPVEARGIERARAEVERADVVITLWPADGAPPPPLPIDTTATILRVRSKADLVNSASDVVDADADATVDVVLSARSGVGVDQLLAALTRTLVDDGEPPLVHTARQEQALLEAANAIDDATVALSTPLPDELVCSELRRAARGLDRLLGTDVGNDVLDLVFSRFCIGK